MSEPNNGKSEQRGALRMNNRKVQQRLFAPLSLVTPDGKKKLVVRQKKKMVGIKNGFPEAMIHDRRTARDRNFFPQFQFEKSLSDPTQ